MRRREFIALFGGTAAAWPVAARAQQTGRLPIVGFLGTDATAWSPWTAAFVARLRELGWIEERTVTIEYRWSEGRPEQTTAFAAEFVRLKVDVIVTAGPAVAITKQATSDIPIVFAIANDPVDSGLVPDLAQPGGNVTGLSIQSNESAGKRLQLLREAVPGLRRFAIMFDANYLDNVREANAVEATARSVGLESTSLEIRRAGDIAPAIGSLKGQARVDALYIVPGSLFFANRTQIIATALSERLPTMFINRENVQAGGLIAYGVNVTTLFRRAADYVDKILHGTKPGNIPIEQPTKFDLVINLTTARALGLTIPASLMSLADELIE
jgi:putative ABC transport system substrate-binding protein